MKINKYFYEKLVKLSSGVGSDEFVGLTKRARYLSSLSISSDEKLSQYLTVKSAASEIGAALTDSNIRKILESDIKSKNDAYYMIVKARMTSKGITKLAYPNYGLSPEAITEEYNVNAWLELVYKIYNSVETGEMSKENALEYYSNSLDEKEKVGFLKWFDYYSAGEHLKYSLEEELDMKKKAVYQSGLGQSGGAYSATNNMPGNSFDGGTFQEVSQRPARNSEEKNAFSTWKQQLYGAIRRVDKLIRSDRYVDHEEYRDLSEALNSLSILAKKVKLARTLSDVTYKTASTFERAGANEAAGILKKIAQEVPSDEPISHAPQVEPTQESVPAAQPPEAELAIPTSDEPEEAADSKSGFKVPSADEVEPKDLKEIMPMPGARPGEYEELAGDVSLEIASAKLDEVAGMLADRRVIRQLAEFDIMLDKIGIASLFPELAESQSKLIDAFSYSLTRVTKMMGQLANARVLVSTSEGVPGSPETAEESEEQLSPDDLSAEQPVEQPLE
jgi:hypothetical protein